MHHRQLKSSKSIEKNLIMKTLESCKGNRTDASNMLGISTRTLRNKLHEYGEMSAFKEGEQNNEIEEKDIEGVAA